jgi:hypothetical protein
MTHYDEETFPLEDAPVTPKENFGERYFGLSTGRLLILLGVFGSFIFYIWILFFGNNSYFILEDLNKYQHFLSKDTQRLKDENARLQKQYFELQELDADAGQHSKH